MLATSGHQFDLILPIVIKDDADNMYYYRLTEIMFYSVDLLVVTMQSPIVHAKVGGETIPVHDYRLNKSCRVEYVGCGKDGSAEWQDAGVGWRPAARCVTCATVDVELCYPTCGCCSCQSCDRDNALNAGDGDFVCRACFTPRKEIYIVMENGESDAVARIYPPWTEVSVLIQTIASSVNISGLSFKGQRLNPDLLLSDYGFTPGLNRVESA